MFIVIRMMNSAGPGATSVKSDEIKREKDAGARVRQRRVDLSGRMCLGKQILQPL